MPGMRINVVGATPPPGAGLSNGDSLIVTPAGGVASFLARTNQVPIVWDNGQAPVNTLLNQWGGGWPSAASNSVANLQNRTGPFQSLGSSVIQTHTPYAQRFLAGNHYDINNTSGGNNVMVWPPSYVPPGATFYSYMEGYELHDPHWWYCQGQTSYVYTATYVAGSNQFVIQGGIPAGFTTGDSNQLFSLNNTAFVSSQASPCNIVAIDVPSATVTMNKTALVTGTFGLQSVAYGNRDENVKKLNSFANSGSPYSGLDWYTTNAPGAPKTNTGGDAYALGQFAGVPANPDDNGHSSSWGACNNPANPNKGWRGGWFKWARAAKWSSGTDGFYKYWETAPNGVSRLIVDYAGPTMYNGVSLWGEAFGGYSRNQGAMGMNPGLTSPVQGTGIFGTYTQWRYYGNGYYDRQVTTLGRFLLTNSPTYVIGDANLAEPMPYTGWAPGQTSVVINKGNLAAGPGYVWYVDEARAIPPTLQKVVVLN